MKKREIYLSPLILAIAGCLLSGCALGGTTGLSRAEKSDPVPFAHRYEKTHLLPASRTIRITSEDADVVVTGSDRDDILIQAHYEIVSTREMLRNFGYRLSVAEEGNELRVVEMRHTGIRGFTYDKRVHSIKIDLPRNSHVTIQEEDGSCVITGVNGGIRLTLDDGKVDLKNCNGDIAIATDGGAFSMSNCGGTVKYQKR